MADVGHDDRRHVADAGGDDDRGDHEGDDAQELSAQQHRSTGLADEELTQRPQAVLRRDLECGNAECDDSQQHDHAVDPMDEPVGPGQDREARQIGAAGANGRRLSEEEDHEDRGRHGQAAEDAEEQRRAS